MEKGIFKPISIYIQTYPETWKNSVNSPSSFITSIDVD